MRKINQSVIRGWTAYDVPLFAICGNEERQGLFRPVGALVFKEKD